MFDDTVAIILCLAGIIASVCGLLSYVVKELRQIKKMLSQSIGVSKEPKEESDDASNS